MRNLSIMIKPASSLCNMRCKYCFYCDEASHREQYSFGIMTSETAENIIKQAIDFAEGGSVYFAFQGGEPLIAGLGFFKGFVALVKKYNQDRIPVYYSIQTNGTLLDSDFCKFLHDNRFLVGLSLDGNYKTNKFRVDDKGQNSYYKIIQAANKLKKFKVEFNILTVLTGFAADNISVIYKYFRDNGFTNLQFIPCLRPVGSAEQSELYMTPEQYTKFLIEGFNLYVKDFVRGNYISVREFDNLVRLYFGEQAEQCGMNGFCSHQFVFEGNGNVYPCDFFCADEWLLGNINKDTLSDMANGDKAKSFITESLAVSDECKACPYYRLCRGGGCKRRKMSGDYCRSYKEFFSACLPLFRAFTKNS